ncbi:uncharacterized protein O3Q21_007452 [Podargus strigoides]
MTPMTLRAAQQLCPLPGMMGTRRMSSTTTTPPCAAGGWWWPPPSLSPASQSSPVGSSGSSHGAGDRKGRTPMTSLRSEAPPTRGRGGAYSPTLSEAPPTPSPLAPPPFIKPPAPRLAVTSPEGEGPKV